jgi:hypothetical protein
VLYPTNWYVLIHINSCHKKEIESWRYLSPSWLWHCLSPSSRCATLLSCAVNCRRPSPCPVHRLPPSRFAPPPRCPRRHSLRAAAVLAPLSFAPPPRCRRRRSLRAVAALPLSRCAPPPCCCRRRSLRQAGCRRVAVAAAPPPSCRRCRCCRRRCRRSAVHWLVVALLSTVRLCHRMPSCDRRRSHCQREHFCTNWYVLIRTTSILAINIDSTRTNCTNLYKIQQQN